MYKELILSKVNAAVWSTLMWAFFTGSVDWSYTCSYEAMFKSESRIIMNDACILVHDVKCCLQNYDGCTS